MLRKILGIAAVSLVVLISITFYISSNNNPLSKETNISSSIPLDEKTDISSNQPSDAKTCISEDQPQQLKTWQISTESEAYYANDILYLELESVCNQLGYAVSSTDPQNEIQLTNDSEIIRIYPDDNIIEQNGHSIKVSDISDQDALGAGCIRLDGVLYMRSDLLSDLFGLDIQADETGKTVTIRCIPKNSLTIDTKHIDVAEDLLTATIQYPVLSGPWDPAALENINGIFKQEADAALAQGRKNAKELTDFASQPDASYGDLPQCSTYFDYAVKYNGNGLLSVILTNYQDAGGAHGFTIQTGYTFDLNTGSQLTISDLMKSNSGYKEFLDEQIRKEIELVSREVRNF